MERHRMEYAEHIRTGQSVYPEGDFGGIDHIFSLVTTSYRSETVSYRLPDVATLTFAYTLPETLTWLAPRLAKGFGQVDPG